jgi:hypothetical protein
MTSLRSAILWGEEKVPYWGPLRDDLCRDWYPLGLVSPSILPAQVLTSIYLLTSPSVWVSPLAIPKNKKTAYLALI